MKVLATVRLPADLALVLAVADAVAYHCRVPVELAPATGAVAIVERGSKDEEGDA